MADLAQQLAEVLMDRFPDESPIVANPADWLHPPEGRDHQFQLGWWAALTMVARTATDALTEEEHGILRTISDLAADYIDLVGDGPTAAEDFGEILPHLHALQQTVMAQAAARTHPGKYRLLGGEE